MTARAGGAAFRKRMRAARRALPADVRAAADAAIITGIRQLAAFRSARRVATFFAFDGEPDLDPLLRHAGPREFFIPVISKADMQFAAIGPATELALNHFGILEPVAPVLIDPRSLDLVLTPLVAFDSHGNRIGVGAGYYDRCFSFLLRRTQWLHPKLLGVAYGLQEIDACEPASWDVPLWGVHTEYGFRQFGREQ